MTLNPIGNSKNPIANSNHTNYQSTAEGLLICIIAAIFKSSIQELFQTKKNSENATAESDKTIEQRQAQQNQNTNNNLNKSNASEIKTSLFPEIAITEEQKNAIKELDDLDNCTLSKIVEILLPGVTLSAEEQAQVQKFDDSVKNGEININELKEKFQETSDLYENIGKPFREMTGVDSQMIFHITKKYQKPQEIEDFILKNLVRIPADLLSSLISAYNLKCFCHENSVDEESINLEKIYENRDQIMKAKVSIAKKIARELDKLSPENQKVVREKLFKASAKESRFLQDQLDHASNSDKLKGNSMSAQFTQMFCEHIAEGAGSPDLKKLSVRIQRNNPDEKSVLAFQENAKKFGEAKKELTGIAEVLDCSIPELVIRFSPRIIGESGEEIAFSDTTIYVLLENARKFLRDQLLEEEESRKTRQKERNKVLKLKRNHEPQTEPICIPTREETSSAAKSQKNVSNHQQNVTKQSNHSIGTNDGFIQVPFRNETSSSNTPLKINFNQQIPVDRRVLRWDCSSDKSSETFLNEIKNFTDKNSTKRYFHMSEEDLIDQQRRHNIPYIEILLAQKWFLKNYALKIHNPEDPFSESYFLLVESFLGKNSLGVEMLSIGLATNHAEPLLYHCFIHPQEEFLSFESKNHSFKNLVDTTHTIATPLPSKRSSLPKITVLDQPDGSRKVRVSGEDSFTSDHRTLVFLPVNLMNRNK